MEYIGAIGIYSNKYFAANYFARDFRRRLLSTGTILDYQDNHGHGLRTPNEGINMKIWAMWQTKYASSVPKNVQ